MADHKEGPALKNRAPAFLNYSEEAFLTEEYEVPSLGAKYPTSLRRGKLLKIDHPEPRVKFGTVSDKAG